MGLKPKEFYDLSPNEFNLMVKGLQRQRLDQYKLNRNILFIMTKLWAKDGPKNPEDLWDLGDKQEQDEDEIKKLFEALKNGG